MPSLKDEILIFLKDGLLFSLSDPLHQFKIGTSCSRGAYYNTIRRLTDEGHIEKLKKEKENKSQIRLTEQGKRYIKKHQESDRRLTSTWDKKWRLVVFDIPEEKRILRDHLRRYLKMLGFGKVQRSIWISPYNFIKEIKKYTDKLKLAGYVFQITADEFQGFSESVLVQTFWNINDIHNKYLALIERYTEKQKELVELLKINPIQNEKGISRRVLREHLIWDYQSIFAGDPHLPYNLLPDDWGGEKARKFIDSFPNPGTGKKNSRSLKTSS